MGGRDGYDSEVLTLCRMQFSMGSEWVEKDKRKCVGMCPNMSQS